MSMLLGSAGESIPVADGELCMGTWQRVLFIELDRSRPAALGLQGRRQLAPDANYVSSTASGPASCAPCSAGRSNTQNSRPITWTATL